MLYTISITKKKESDFYERQNNGNHFICPFRWSCVDRFYLGYTGMGVLKLLTGGCFGVLWILDIVNIASGKLQPADGSGYSDASSAAGTSKRN